MALLDIQGLERSFYGLSVLKGVDITAEAGSITGLIGPNGAGKTTLFNCVSGMMPSERGRVLFNGEDLTGRRPDKISRSGLLRTFQIARGLPKLTVLENLMAYSGSHPGETLLSGFHTTRRARDYERDLLDRAIEVAAQLRLTGVLNNLAEDISGGQKKLLEIGRALMSRPKLILLDEPIAGVNPSLSVEIAQRIVELRDQGLSFLIIEHNMDMISNICDPVIVMADGRKLTEGSFDEIANNHIVQEAYMGKMQ